MTWRNGKKQRKHEKVCPPAKTCPKCGRTLFRESFYFNMKTSDFLSFRCKDCQYKYAIERKEKKKERALEWLNKKESK